MKNKKNKKGMTLVETLMAIVIFALGMGGFTLLFSRSLKINYSILEEGNAISAGSKALNDVVKNIRRARQSDDGSYLIKAVDGFELTIYADEDNDGKTERLHYFLDNAENFKKGVSEPAGNPAVYPNEDQNVVIIASYITNTPTQPIFDYYNKDYPIDVINNPLVNPKISDIRLVKVHFWVNIKPEIAPENINIESFAEFRNLNEIN
jgi:type II secretory pathway pseudopilin PulG